MISNVASQALDPINRVSYLEERCYMLNTLLRDSDFMSMAHGLEVRVPLIDHVLAKRMLSMPGSMKLDSQTPKPLLVRALGGTLPRQIVHRPKRGFTLPFEHWLRQELRPEITRNLSAMRGVLEGVVRPNAGSTGLGRFRARANFVDASMVVVRIEPMVRATFLTFVPCH